MPANRFLSIPYLLLRSSTAGGGLVAGLIQTFVFARILSPERFSIFILVGTLGTTLWLFDLGMSKIIFVRMREWFLAGCKGESVAPQATAIVILYTALAAAGTVLCFAISAIGLSTSPLHALEFALFFLFTSLNLVWFALRNISVAADEFIAFESLEVARRVGHIAVLLATLAGLPLIMFLIIANLFWAALFASAIARLARRGALIASAAGFSGRLRDFLRENRKEVLQTGTYALNEFYIYSFPYFVVPMAFGLGAPTIILDTAFKVFRGATVLFSAGCDLAVPRQTRAFAERDRRSLILATLMAVALCSLPAIVLCGLLLFAADEMFAILLGPAATMPAAAGWILIVLLVANLVQTVSNFLLVHTGFFGAIARLAVIVSVAMTIATAIVVLAGFDFLGFLQVYMAVYMASALLYMLLAIRGPIRAAAQP